MGEGIIFHVLDAAYTNESAEWCVIFQECGKRGSTTLRVSTDEDIFGSNDCCFSLDPGNNCVRRLIYGFLISGALNRLKIVGCFRKIFVITSVVMPRGPREIFTWIKCDLLVWCCWEYISKSIWKSHLRPIGHHLPSRFPRCGEPM